MHKKYNFNLELEYFLLLEPIIINREIRTLKLTYNYILKIIFILFEIVMYN